MTSPVAGFRLAVKFRNQNGQNLYLTDDSAWTITTGSSDPSFPSSKLTQDMLSDYWSSLNARASNSWVQATGPASQLNIGVIGLLGVNRIYPIGITNVTTVGVTPSTSRFRVDTFALADRIRPPFTITSTVNLTGASSNFTGHPIDPPDDPPPAGYAETKLSPTNSALPTSLIGTWPNSYATERALSGTQTLRVHMRDVNNPTFIPSVTAVIYQSAAPVVTVTGASWEKVAVLNSSGGFIMSYPFNASLLSTAVMELHIATSTACDFIGIELIQNHTGYLFDSGVVDMSGTDVQDLAQRLDLPINGTYWIHVDTGDFCLYKSGTYTAVVGGTLTAKTYFSIIGPGDADGRFHAGRFLAADTATFPISNTGGWNIQSASSISLSRTRSGSLHGSRFPVEWTEADMLLPGGSLSRPMLAKIERILKSIGIMQYPTLLIPDPNMMEGSVERQNAPRWMMLSSRTENHVGQMTGINNDVLADGSNHSFNRYDIQLHWVEHNGSKYGGGG